MKRILGLDLGPSSIGFATITQGDNTEETTKLEISGVRAIPMDAGKLSDFEKGNPQSQTHERTVSRGIRRNYERKKLSRHRLLKVLNLLNWLPPHFANALKFEGSKVIYDYDTEPKIAWIPDTDGNYSFAFQNSFNEMVADFAKHQPQLVADGKKIPYDWTLYYLRKKAISEKISKEELAWVLLSFTAKRGYNEQRGELSTDSDKKKSEEYISMAVTAIETDDNSGKKKTFKITFEDGRTFAYQSTTMPDWIGSTQTFIAITNLNQDGTPKGIGTLRELKEEDWTLKKVKTEQTIASSIRSESDHRPKTVGWFIYDAILRNPEQKIIGGLVSVIDRHFYKEELTEILESQARFHPEFSDSEKYQECVGILYPANESYRNTINGKDLQYLFVDNIIFYQRPLKSKKSLIANCPFEQYSYTKDGKEETKPIKCIAKSNPLYQEFRLWQFINNLKILQRTNNVDGKLQFDVDVSPQFLSDECKANLFEALNDLKEINQSALLRILGIKQKEAANYRWNYPEDKRYPCNETRNLILKYWKQAGLSDKALSYHKEFELWHLLYSFESKEESEIALKAFAEKYDLPEQLVDSFKKFPAFKKDYGAYSAKAIKKFLPLMRSGRYWNADNIDSKTLIRIENLTTGESNPEISSRVRDKAKQLESIEQFTGMQTWLASYVVYGRHSEAKDIDKWEKPEDIDRYLLAFKQHSLRNPIVEQVVMETLRVVRDIWKQTGHIDEIHIELARDMKNPADKKKKIADRMAENENTNIRIKTLLMEFYNDPEFGIEDVHPYSPIHQEKLKIYEESALNDKSDKIPDDIYGIIRKFNERDVKKQPSKQEVMRYKLWLEQRYRSPYTGRFIPLAKLFTSAYEIEHVIPRALYFDDSLSNKVICESSVNKDKSKQLAYNYIKANSGKVLPNGIKLFTIAEYEDFIKSNYSHNRAKRDKLLATEIPDSFSERQMNDTRYISRFIMQLLSNIVRERDDNGNLEQEAISKNLIPCTGGITDKLKRDWGIGQVWNELVAPRFERLNKLHGNEQFGSWVCEEGKRYFRIEIPLEMQRGFSKKRIDHRHHAMDAIIIACANRNIINYLNNVNSRSENSRRDLRSRICTKTKTDADGNYEWLVNKPWATFTEDVKQSLSQLIVSIKHRQRILTRASNQYRCIENGKYVVRQQEKGDKLAIRKQLHKESYYGLVNLRRQKAIKIADAIENPNSIVDKQLKQIIKKLIAEGIDKKKIISYLKDNFNADLKKVAVYYFSNDTKDEQYVAIRKCVDASFDKKTIQEKVTDTGIQKILINHLGKFGDDPKLAFSPQGLEEMNANIAELNGGKDHKPIRKVRIYETKGLKFQLGECGAKKKQYVEAAKGTNLFFAVYVDTNGNRSFESIPLNVAIARLKGGESPVPECNLKGNQLLFSISPNDFVYVPTPDEIERGYISKPLDRSRIYKMVSATTNQCFFTPFSIASPIEKTIELGSNDKAEKSWTGEMIKTICQPIKIDRLGNITLLSDKII